MMPDPRRVPTHVGFESAVDEHRNSRGYALLHRPDPPMDDRHIGVPQDLQLGDPRQEVHVGRHRAEVRERRPAAQTDHEVPVGARGHRFTQTADQRDIGGEERPETGIDEPASVITPPPREDRLELGLGRPAHATLPAPGQHHRTKVVDTRRRHVRKVELQRVHVEGRQPSIGERDEPLTRVCLKPEVEADLTSQLVQQRNPVAPKVARREPPSSPPLPQREDHPQRADAEPTPTPPNSGSHERMRRGQSRSLPD